MTDGSNYAKIKYIQKYIIFNKINRDLECNLSGFRDLPGKVLGGVGKLLLDDELVGGGNATSEIGSNNSRNVLKFFMGRVHLEKKMAD